MKLPQIISQAKSAIKTDLDYNTLTSLGFSVSEFDINDVKTATIPGYFLDENGVSYWGVNVSEVQKAVAELLEEE